MANSDYTKARTDLYQSLPKINRTPLNQSVFENLYNRFLSKTELDYVFGTIGKKNPTAKSDTRVIEPSVDRQAFQLQPLIYTKIATTDHILSYKDVLTECVRLGIDISRLPKWGNALQFNFAPPIDPDKLINYQDYYWYDPKTANPVPDYITIKSLWKVAQAQYNQKLQEYNDAQQDPTATQADLDRLAAEVELLEAVSVSMSNGNSLGWDTSLWDDSPSEWWVPLIDQYGSATAPDHATTKVWYDTTQSLFKVWDPASSSWVECEQPTGMFAFDASQGYVQTDAWSTSNKWYHKSDVPNISIARRAQMPIIEYNPMLELNAWTYTKHLWNYRASSIHPWAPSDVGPTDAEILSTISGVAPATTSKGDKWVGFYDQWMFVGTEQAVPVNLQAENTNVQFGQTVAEENQAVFSSGRDYMNGDDQIRVYLNTVRQYGNYEEGYVTNGDITTFVTGSTNGVSNAIRFFNGLKQYDVVRIETSSAATSDINRNFVSVRTTPDDNFTPEIVSLIDYRKVEQVKTSQNQYPLFDIFNVDGTTAYKANPLFTFKESQDAPVNPYIGKRLLVTNYGRDFNFEQTLLDQSTGALLCYVDQQSIDAGNATGLQTVWRKGLNNEQYVPRFVNDYCLADGDTYMNYTGTQQTAHVDSTNGTWEIPNQLMYNANHENRTEFALSELITHFRTIIENQTCPPLFAKSSRNFYRLLDKVNYGVGGTIKEFNGSYDTFLSSMYQDTVTVPTLVDFAQSEYSNSIVAIKESFKAKVTDLLMRLDDQFFWNLEQAVADSIITSIITNDVYDYVYGDTTAYDETTKKGMKNWIATLPLLGLSKATIPSLLVDKKLGFVKVVHHDGHVSSIVLDQSFINNVIKKLLSVRGMTSATRPPISEAIRGGYWQDPTTKELYKANVIAIAPTAPSVANPEGTLWFNTRENRLYVRDAGSYLGWVPFTGSEDAAWKKIDFETILATTIVEVENKLYDIVQEMAPNEFNYKSLVQDDQDKNTFADNVLQTYYDFIQQQGLNPFATDFSATDPFTWNYSGVDLSHVSYPTLASGSASVWGARYTTINNAIFNTKYPHLEPWKLQGYATKPDWWDSEYKDVSGIRRWSSLMWTNVKAGIVPANCNYPDGSFSTGNPVADGKLLTRYSHVSVNTTDQTIDGYAPDDLLPPFYGNNTPLLSEALVRSIAYVNMKVISSSYAFGQEGPTEAAWKESGTFPYGIAKVAYLMQPAKFLDSCFGINKTTVAGLDIDTRTGKVYSHKDAIFHGDLIDGNIYKCNGINQWFINYLRTYNIDSITSDFRTKWTGWNPTLSYQTSSFINSKSLAIANKNFNITPQDYAIKVKSVSGVADFWMDSLNVSISQIGAYSTKNGFKIPRTDGRDWSFVVGTPTPVARKISYYGVKEFAFSYDETTGNFVSTRTLPWFIEGSESATWVTGTAVFLNSPEPLPHPLRETIPYYLIKVSDNVFKLANSYTDATVGLAITITPNGNTEMNVGEMVSDFMAAKGANTSYPWKHYAIDKTNIQTVYMPLQITSVQNVINFIDGYAEYYKDQGFAYHDQSVVEIDVELNTTVSWQSEIERMVDSLYAGIDTSIIREVNPIRNNVWLNPGYGVIANVKTGPVGDIRTVTTVYDQNGAKFPDEQLFVLRQDTLTRIFNSCPTGSTYDDDMFQNNVVRSYADTHIGGLHVFVDTYEHVIMFNNYAIDGSLIYDPYLGLNTSKFNVEFERSPNDTRRPNVGGYYYYQGNLLQNFEQSVENIRNFYDTYTVNESADFLNYARGLLGYQDPTYLDYLNSNSKSKFVFWRGMIRNKGSINSVKAFINSKLFLDANVDEFWAYKVAEYGNVLNKQYPEIFLSVADLFKTDMRFHFVTDKTPNDGDQTFNYIDGQDKGRWVDLPDLKQSFGSIGNLYFDATSMAPISASDCLVSTNSDGSMIIKVAQASDDIMIVKGSVILKEGTDYTKINHHYFTLAATVGTLNDVKVFPIVPNKQKLNPVKLFDYKSDVLINNVIVWNPAFGFQYQTAMQNITLINNSDIAAYNNSADTTISNYQPEKSWSYDKVGTVWLDTSKLAYVPYYDKVVFPTTESRLLNFGKVADYASIDIYEWTESDHAPVDYINTVATQATNNSIAPNDKLTGSPKKVLYTQTLGIDGLTWSDWSIIPQDPYQEWDMAVNQPLLTTKVFTTNIGLIAGQSVLVYLNGAFIDTVTTGQGGDGTSVVVDLSTTIPTLRTCDSVRIVNQLYFYDDQADNELAALQSDTTQYKYDYPYTSVDTVDNFGNVISTKYYFWVKDKQNVSNTKPVSLYQTSMLIRDPAVPYVVFDGLYKGQELDGVGGINRYCKSIIRGIVGNVTDDNRYKLRFGKTFSLRDEQDIDSGLTVKNSHEEWAMFREKQSDVIPRDLWDKLTEAMMGVKLSDMTTIVPSSDRVLYDAANSATTRFGLGDGQALVDANIAINTVLQEIQDPNYDLYPIDAETFFSRFSFDTAEHIKSAMDQVYSTFPSTAVNRIFFSVLQDALAMKTDYVGLFKTSGVALHGIRLLETSENVIDD